MIQHRNENKRPLTRLESAARKIKRTFPWMGNPFLLVALSLLLTHVIDMLASSLLSWLALLLAGFDISTPLGRDDLGKGVVVMGTALLIYAISFPFWLWVCVKKMFKLFFSED